jgi:hypothetical protein
MGWRSQSLATRRNPARTTTPDSPDLPADQPWDRASPAAGPTTTGNQIRAHEAAIRDFVAMVDPVTGYIEDADDGVDDV